MISIEVFRENPERIKDSQRRRGKEPGKVEEVIELDEEWREKLQELESLQQERNTVGDEIAAAKQNGEDAEEKIERMQEVKQKIQELEDRVDEVKEERDSLRYEIANLLGESVPEGDGEEDNPELRTWEPEEGKADESELAADIIERNNLLLSEKAAEVGGERAYYLTTELVQLNQALTSFALDFIKEKGFETHQTPYMLEGDAISAAVDMEAFEDQLYQVNENGRYLIATAEHALAVMKKDEVIGEGELPLKLGGFSTNFRREAGKHGKQTRGLWRVHQFEKVEQFMFTHPDNHIEHLEWMLENAEEIMQELGLPYRVVDICDGDIGDKTFKQYDIEVWRPPLGEYGEVGSYGSCIDYQANKLGTQFFEDGDRKTPYTVYATALANPRIITAIMENNQTEKGIKIPEALQSYMGGREYLEID
ncbi:serine--tRNA ligase [Candidatus Nanohalobium constans]|uniref:Serine--tRNA ligase n=1 Tax=Candidatus Nanohalobium constans TaxID=2565781 RepID=A0A5Q0UF67_9ARCH|nr:serine--tRNA ligase [Candidatus Nanohalobium constans]QGA79991.1 seryl-tRNA synthetase [Candidatus Nanohalobium constans]